MIRDKEVVIVDYGVGNLFSILQACEKVDVVAKVTSEAEQIEAADVIILPGVGAFDRAMNALSAKNQREVILRAANAGRHIFGICLGMQLLFEHSEENGSHEGLGLLKGSVSRLPDIGLRIPAIGWSRLEKNQEMSWTGTPFSDITNEDSVYFVHSYFAHPSDPNNALSFTPWGNRQYCSAVLRDNIFGCQFHPEKSGETGLNIFRNYFGKVL